MNNDSVRSVVSQEGPPARFMFLGISQIGRGVGGYERKVWCMGERGGGWFAVIVSLFAADEDVDVVFPNIGVVAGGFYGRNSSRFVVLFGG